MNKSGRGAVFLTALIMAVVSAWVYGSTWAGLTASGVLLAVVLYVIGESA